MTGAQAATPIAAQQATPMAAAMATLDVPLIDAAGDAVGLATFSENADGVTVRLLIEDSARASTAGTHAIGLCEPDSPEPFSSAGEHWNPTAQPHGGPDTDERHAGDFGNLVASEDGLAEIEITTSDFTLEAGPTSVFDEDGTSIVVHEGTDDLATSRTATAALAMPAASAEPTIDMTAMQAATPMATPMTMATPLAMATPITMATPEDSAATPMP